MPTGLTCRRRALQRDAMSAILLVLTLFVVVPALAAQAAAGPVPIDPDMFVEPSPMALESSLGCEWLSYHGDPAYYWTDNGDLDTTDFFTIFSPAVDCTVKTARVAVYTSACQGTPTLRLRVYGQDYDLYDGYPYPDVVTSPPGTESNLVAEIDVPWGNIVDGWNTIDLTGLANWPNDFLYGALSTPFFLSASLSPNTPNPGTDKIAFMTDGGHPDDTHSGAYFGDRYWFFNNYTGTGYETLIEAEVCYSYEPPLDCYPDEWATWAHDYNRSCQSAIPVGDPCEMRAAWKANLPNFNSFCEPTVADGRVYISSDQEISVYDLTNGYLINTAWGLPFTFSQTRCNVTVAGGNAYLTGGTAQSLSKWDADLTSSAWVNGIGVGNGPLGGNTRFGVTTVYDIGGTEVVVAGSEGGVLWCFRTSDGMLFPGWPTNPVILDQGIVHSPAYDGDDLYVGTSNTGFSSGSIYRIDAATGAITWHWTSSIAGESYPSGVSLDGEYVFAASAGANESGQRVKLNKDGTLIWELPESRSLYGPPAYDRNFLYIPQDGPYPGVYLVDKLSGNILYNFGSDGVGEVPQHVTLSCDGFAFCGDRYGTWWLLDIYSQEATRLYDPGFGGIVNGTALATDPGSGNEYAVVSIRSGNASNGGGQLVAYQLHSGARPRVVDNVPAVDVFVPFDAPTYNAHTEPDVMSNTGCADLVISSYSIDDQSPDPTAQAYASTYERYAARVADEAVGTGYLSYFDAKPSDKTAEHYHALVDGELTHGDVQLDRLASAMIESKRRDRQLKAEASLLRTSAVSYNTPIPQGGSTDVGWTWESTGLKRGIDIEVIEFATNDPDRIFFNDQPTLTIWYIGGCLRDSTQLNFGDVAPDKSEYLYNMGHIGYDLSNQDLVWEGVAGQLYDGSFVLCGDSLTGDAGSGQGGAEFHASFFDAGGLIPSWPGHFVPNPRPSDGTCNFDGNNDVHLGYRQVGGCAGAPEEIRGEWARSFYVDTNQSVTGGSPLAAIGVEVTQTEVGAHDPLYGDFKIIRWELHNRDGVSKTLYAGSMMDWDVGDSDPGHNDGFVSDAFNGYALWNANTPGVAFGMFEPNLPTDFATVDPQPHSPHRIHLMANDIRLWCYHSPMVCMLDSPDQAWNFCVNYTPSRETDPFLSGNPSEDVSGLLINEPITLPANGDAVIHQVLFGVDGSSADSATIEANVLELAERAAKWAGFARGDVNDDGAVDVLDVCWLMSGHQLYPDSYNGDVDLSGTVDMNDRQFLLQYITGFGPAPVGAWRFEF